MFKFIDVIFVVSVAKSNKNEKDIRQSGILTKAETESKYWLCRRKENNFHLEFSPYVYAKKYADDKKNKLNAILSIECLKMLMFIFKIREDRRTKDS